VEHVFQQHETLRLGRENTEPNAQITKLIRPPKVCVQNICWLSVKMSYKTVQRNVISVAILITIYQDDNY